MYEGKKFLAVIPARGGSKGVPRKNIKMLAGKPLIAWTIDEAKKSKFIDTCIVSTEDEEIKKVAENCGGCVPFLRPAELAQDSTPGIEVILHAMEKFPDYDYIVLLQPTSPLRLVEDIDGAIEFCIKQKSNSADWSSCGGIKVVETLDTYGLREVCTTDWEKMGARKMEIINKFTLKSAQITAN